MRQLVMPLALSGALLANPAQAFFDEIVLGLTSVTNNLIDSGESVANNTLTTTSTTVLVLSRDIGKMADRIGLMADRIGVMADRIVLTESMLATFAHKLVDTGALAHPLAQATPRALASTLACATPASVQSAQVC